MKRPADLLTIDNAMREFHVGRASLFRYIAAGKLARFTRAMDHRTYVSRQELKRLLAFKKER